MSKGKGAAEVLKAESERFEQLQKGLKERQDLALLVSGVAHEFNNILGAADGHAEWALDEGDPESMKEALGVLRKACERCRQITKSLSAFTQPREETVQLFDMKDVLDELQTLLSPQLKGVKWHMSVESAKVLGRSHEVLEILLNLAKNALESFDKSQVQQGAMLKVEGKTLKKQYQVLIMDNGQPIPQAFTEQIFAPFFSTKGVHAHLHGKAAGAQPLAEESPLGAGARGLGLFLSARLAKEHGGELKYLGEKNGFKSFALLLPT